MSKLCQANALVKYNDYFFFFLWYDVYDVTETKCLLIMISIKVLQYFTAVLKQ